MKNNQLLPCKVIILPTDASSLLYITKGTLHFEEYSTKSVNAGNQHLYLTSDREIEEGNCAMIKTVNGWVVGIIKNVYHTTFKLVTANKSTVETEKNCYIKIEASTDPSLGVPLINDDFILAYVKAEGKIDEVNIEMIKIYDEVAVYIEDKVKTRPDNTAIIHQSKMYTREEVENLLIDYAAQYGASIISQTQFSSGEWMKKNL